MIVSGNNFLIPTCPRFDSLCKSKAFDTALIYSFNLKLEQLIFKKALKFVLLDNYFPDLFTEVQIWHWKPFKFGLWRSFKKIK